MTMGWADGVELQPEPDAGCLSQCLSTAVHGRKTGAVATADRRPLCTVRSLGLLLGIVIRAAGAAAVAHVHMTGQDA